MARCHPDRKHRARGLCRQCYDAAYEASHREERRSAFRARYAAHREECRAAGRAEYAAHRERYRLYAAAHKTEARMYKVRIRGPGGAETLQRASLKLAALNAYGGAKCACCGETLILGLTLDHVNGDGAQWRKEHGKGEKLYRWVKKRNYPPGFQVLCGTCNMAKGTGDHCPHQDGVKSGPA